MSTLSFYLSQSCVLKLKENVKLTLEKLANPKSWVDVNVTGALVDAAMGGLGGLASFAKDYLARNSDALLVAALQATGLEKTLLEAYNVAMNMMAAAIMARNDLLLRMMKETAWSLMREIVKKDNILITLAEDVKQLHLLLASLVGTSHMWDEYFAKLRQALSLVASTRTDLRIVRNTFSSSDYWLAKKFEGTVAKLEQAKNLITPKNNNPAIQKISEGSYLISTTFSTATPDKTRPQKDNVTQAQVKTKRLNQGVHAMETGLAYFGEGLTDKFPLPTTEQKWQAAVAIGNLSKKIMDDLQGYFGATATVNVLVASFITGLDSVSAAIPTFFKNFILSLMDKSYARVDTLCQGMALTINGKETAVYAPIAGFRPTSLAVTPLGLKWIAEINLILQGYKLIPTKQLSALNLNKAAVDFYKSTVRALLAMDNKRSGTALLKMTDGQELLSDVETQVLALVIEANAASVSSVIKGSILQLSRTVLSRLELSLYRDNQIYNLMLAFWNYPLPEEEVLNNIYNGLIKMFDSAGMDHYKDLLIKGDFKKLLRIRGRDASYVGAALSTIALLKKCFKTQSEKNILSGVESDLNSQSDLLNITFSVNFDLAIFKNLDACLRLKGLSGFFQIKETLCGIVNDIPGMSTLFTKINSLFSFWGGS